MRLIFILAALSSCGASHRTANFIVSGANEEQVVTLARDAERHRRELALEWFGEELPAWREPCPINVLISPDQQSRGRTSYVFRAGRPAGWEMEVEGSWEGIRYSVLPHEITHTLFASYFRRPLPRWAEEGACVIVESQQDRRQLEQLFLKHMAARRTLSLARLFTLQDYPPDVLALYSQSYSLVQFFLTRGGKRKFVAFVSDGLSSQNWQIAAQRHYGFDDLHQLQSAWLTWTTAASS